MPPSTGKYARITDDQWRSFFTQVEIHGLPKKRAAEVAGISWSTIMRIGREERAGTYDPRVARLRYAIRQANPEPPKLGGELSSDAARALVDFDFFRRRYLGHISMPWHVEAAERLAAELETPDKSLFVVNCPPGAGKSTLFTMDIPTWLIVRRRNIRCLLGHAAQMKARDYSQQIRRYLETPEPLQASDDDIKKGLACHAEATLVGDFGRFRPDRGEAWRDTDFVVVQDDGAVKSKKEATVATAGRDTSFIGHRADYSAWDDLVDDQSVRSPDYRENLRNWWMNTAERRIDPGGVLALVGQRLHAEDLYRTCIDFEVMDYGNDLEEVGRRKLYEHVTFKAHYEEHCQNDHKLRAKPYDPKHPDTSGCLLDPVRVGWTELMGIRSRSERAYSVVYQQEDADPGSVLVPELWIKGGRDPDTGIEYPGCWDKDRPCGVVPRGISRPFLSIVTADPSPTKFWSIQWWLYQPSTELRLLVDHKRQAMGANDFLDNLTGTNEYTGLLEDWWLRAKDQGAPITHVIVEQNAAQRFLLQYDHVKKWQAKRAVKILPHNTYSNKTDPKFGIQATLPQQYQHGRVRLPGDRISGSRTVVLPLVNEVTKWPEVGTEDCVMAQWFLEFNLPRLRNEALISNQDPPAFDRPSWVARGALRRVV